MKYLSLTRWRAKVRIGAEFQFHQIPGAAVFIAEVEGIRQHFEQSLSSSRVVTFLMQGLPQCARVINDLLKMQVRLLFLFRIERSTIYGDRKLQIAVLGL